MEAPTATIAVTFIPLRKETDGTWAGFVVACVLFIVLVVITVSADDEYDYYEDEINDPDDNVTIAVVVVVNAGDRDGDVNDDNNH